jgi:hypothetical protein
MTKEAHRAAAEAHEHAHNLHTLAVFCVMAEEHNSPEFPHSALIREAAEAAISAAEDATEAALKASANTVEGDTGTGNEHAAFAEGEMEAALESFDDEDHLSAHEALARAAEQHLLAVKWHEDLAK